MIPDLSFMIRATNMTGGAFGAVQSQLRGTRGMMATLGTQATRLGRSMRNIGFGMSAAMLPVTMMLRDSIRLFDIQDRAQAQVRTAVESTGGAAGYAADNLFEMASALQRITRFGDEDILQNVTGPLLTFTNIAGPQFDEAQMAILNVATALQMDLKSASLQVGKALNDPVLGISALSRAGIQFTQDQRAMIRGMVEAGDVAGAQAVILGELQRQFGGQAEAAALAGIGPIVQLGNAWGDLKEIIGKTLVPLLVPVVEWMWNLVDAFSKLSPETQKFIVAAAGIASVLGPVLAMTGLLLMGLKPLIGLFALLASPVVLVVGALAALGAVLYSFRSEIADGFVRGLEGIDERTSGLAGSMMGYIDSIGRLLRGDFAGAWEAAKAATGDALGKISEIVGVIFSAIGSAIDGIVNLLSGDFSGAWESVKEIVRAVGRVIELVIGTDAMNAVSAFTADTYLAITGAFSDAWDWAVEKVTYVRDTFVAFKDAALQAVADLVNGVIEWLSDTWLGQMFGGLIDMLDQVIEKFRGATAAGQAWKEGVLVDDAIANAIGQPGGTPFVPFGGFRAAGGPVTANTPYVVGEEGAEIFVPDSNGTIIPNDQLGSGIMSSTAGMTQAVAAWFRQMYADIGSMTDSQLGEVVRSFAEMAGSVTDSVAGAAASAASLFDQMGQTISSNLMGWLRQGEFTMNSFREMVASSWTSISDSFFNQAMQPITSALSSGISSFASGLFGGGWGAASPNASGAVVMGPSYFPSRGGMQSMSEQGAEAIMPLERGRNGRLGIRASGGQAQPNITVNIMTRDPDTKVSFEPSRRQTGRALRGV